MEPLVGSVLTASEEELERLVWLAGNLRSEWKLSVLLSWAQGELLTIADHPFKHGPARMATPGRVIGHFEAYAEAERAGL